MSIRYYRGTEWHIFELNQPAHWKKYDLFVLKDGWNTNTGQRLHVVESLPYDDHINILDNAFVVTEDYFNEHFTEAP